MKSTELRASSPPFLRRLDKKAVARVADPLETSPPREWQVTFAERAFLQRKGRLPSFLNAKTAGQALGCVLRGGYVMLVGCHHLRLLSMRAACEIAIAFHLPTSENVSFAEVRLRPTAESAKGLIGVLDLKVVEKRRSNPPFLYPFRLPPETYEQRTLNTTPSEGVENGYLRDPLSG